MPEVELEPPAIDSTVAPILRSLIERTLGLGDIGSYALYERILGGDNLWGGRRPSRYQMDGALRLLSILEGATDRHLPPAERRVAERGAFLTDEPGLGKTLIAQIVAATLAAERLRHRYLQAPASVPVLRISIIAPARIAGHKADSGEAGTGWHAAAQEVREAVQEVLTAYRGEIRDYIAMDPAQLAGRVDIRVFSTTSFGRHVEKDDKLVSDVVEDWFHVARSEVVVVDESHNFRNGQAASTRAIRFLLTLPVPGEQWPLTSGELKNDHGESDANNESTTVRRKVLCLSATPFNNRLEDFVAQVGHFARYQGWCLPAQKGLFSNLQTAITDWNTPDIPEKKRKAAFETLVAAIVRHLRSGRRLDDDEVKAEARERNERARRRPEDEGPLYDWAFPYDDLRRSFAQVAEWLQGYLQGDSSPADESDARARVDALLARLVVQRSRRRILGMMKREGTLEKSFRAPSLPRHPLAIGVEVHEKPPFEAEVLAKLYELLPTAGSTLTEEDLEDRLNLFSYEIGVRRGREEIRAGGTDDVAVRNAVGFQAAGLIKRLQSSPYAFLRTLARGPLRRALFEFAVVEAIGTETPEVPGQLASELAAAHERVVAYGNRLQRTWGARGEAIAGLLGGTWAPKSPRFFQELVNVSSLDQKKRFETAVKLVENALSGIPKKGKRRNGPPRWLTLLFEDLEAQRSRLWIDVEVALGWIIEEGDEGESGALLHTLYRHLEDQHVGLPMDALRGVIDRGEAYTEPVAKWLRSRLLADRRAGWLLGLVVGVAAIDKENARLRAEGAPLIASPGGSKLLVFTEYADTQSYLLALVAALQRTGCEAAWRRVRESVLDNVDLVAKTLRAQTEQITASGGNARSFRSPIDADWTEQWVKEARSAPTQLKDAIAYACMGIAWASSAGAGRLDKNVTAADEAEVGIGEGDEDTTTAALGDDPVLDALSPWYQIWPDPKHPEWGQRVRSRMASALKHPVRTLIATEVLAEGVNLQECGMVAHYDLPWNPTRLIQRNGRVDRRLDPRFEDREGRLAICRALHMPDATADAYHPPVQIYHFTVLPIEPAFRASSGVEPAERVRQVLTRKLKSIRVLFGLASWPVVLRAADAQRVLTGELEFETPGFRRRERLFEQWRRLADSGVALPHPTIGVGGILVVAADDAWFETLRIESAGKTAKGWERIRAAVVQTSPRGRAIHSAVDWQVATKAIEPVAVPAPLVVPNGNGNASAAEPISAINGALVLHGGELLAWAYRQRRRGGISRWSFHPVILAFKNDAPEISNVTNPLSASDEEGRARIPTSPTSFAEDILSVTIDALLEAHLAVELLSAPTAPLEGVEEHATRAFRWYLARPYLDGKPDPFDHDDALAQPPPAGRWNLWVVR